MIFPAIDLHNSQSVRLYQGDYQKVTLINKDPVTQAQEIAKQGVNQIHLVDLDGAKSGHLENYEMIENIRRHFAGFLEFGGGIRDEKTARMYLDMGIDRIIIGSAAIENPDFVKRLLKEYGGKRIVIGVDGKDGKVAVNGWIEQSNILMEDLIKEMMNQGAQSFIVTDVARDGTMTGPNLNLLMLLSQKIPQANLVASGGVRNKKDLHNLRALGIQDVIIGKALYEKTITLKQIVEVENGVSEANNPLS
ncbi:1-(5-phosphoribosyl)-5-[(5-phosphoribosylamino)methylideneamino]imidazole-4-carboxamide isomerase [Companilactobacillus halodurans]|uniref:1-(5-phosphoribosyl)-5-[(5-phosphoribosylamino)methylideneamino] imidazole-4-carboxamide isomerase n=1 Tax=Companilactobacillus halodurans TaxID=2584183 RepID=A0A5P0ZTZ2_9LACO|nr:1-(5-phosphoribosyl)-5-[(5-phosphoribosylamino)methylideneamino]imidazole-4-carboxamide isomerase [Companilactobacillus halodurans]MQS76061.1 1-(5-phosphoribosyl)-5-[(5-phosphoribosylamino)methylideneamino]imidazole-4-carboxamide isomerase [Companilactobacillus halodurans]MQS96497.1 1-(5-phosphoribosyl)-5-[(5-phosphoribosylamino)methylideneamino]imidazole-4-carboxamide isomerase [Companilactobacillus halodurans]